MQDRVNNYKFLKMHTLGVSFITKHSEMSANYFGNLIIRDKKFVRNSLKYLIRPS